MWGCDETFWRERGAGEAQYWTSLRELKGTLCQFHYVIPHDAMVMSLVVHPLQLMDGGANMHQAVSVLLGMMLSFIMGSAVFLISLFFEGLFALQQTSLAVCFTLFCFKSTTSLSWQHIVEVGMM